jgi:hypothetical protein
LLHAVMISMLLRGARTVRCPPHATSETVGRKQFGTDRNSSTRTHPLLFSAASQEDLDVFDQVPLQRGPAPSAVQSTTPRQSLSTTSAVMVMVRGNESTASRHRLGAGRHRQRRVEPLRTGMRAGSAANKRHATMPDASVPVKIRLGALPPVPAVCDSVAEVQTT